MIILFFYKQYWKDLVYFLIQNYNQKYILLSEFNKYYFDKANIIIPFGVMSQNILSDYSEYKNKFLIPDFKWIRKFNNKISFYKFLKNYDIINNTSINLIKSYSCNYKGDNFENEFIIKHKYGAGSSKNEIVKGNIYDIIEKYHINHQVQEIIDVLQIEGINCLCKNGKVINMINFIMPGFINKYYYKNKNIEKIGKIHQDIKKIIEKIVNITNYSGFIEFEFIRSKDNKIYILECNPRISGNLKIKQNNDFPFIKQLITPYCDIILGNKTRTFNNNFGITTFYGNIKIPKLLECKCGCKKLRFIN